MLMTRRSFLGSILAAAVAPAIVRADSLMRIVPRDALFLDADMLLNGEAVSKLLSLPLVSYGRMFEEYNTIDVTTLGSACKEMVMGVYHYSVMDVEYQLPPGTKSARIVSADGISIELDNVEIVRDPSGLDRVIIKELDVTQFGNRIPNFNFEVDP